MGGDGDCISGQSIRNSHACVESGTACRRDGRFHSGESILMWNSSSDDLPLFSIEKFIILWYNMFVEMGCEHE